jgi:hypothetical protein
LKSWSLRKGFTPNCITREGDSGERAMVGPLR